MREIREISALTRTVPRYGSATEVLWARQERVLKMDPQVHFAQKKKGMFLSIVRCIKESMRRFESHCHRWLQNPVWASAPCLCNQCRGKSTISAEFLTDSVGET